MARGSLDAPPPQVTIPDGAWQPRCSTAPGYPNERTSSPESKGVVTPIGSAGRPGDQWEEKRRHEGRVMPSSRSSCTHGAVAAAVSIFCGQEPPFNISPPVSSPKEELHPAVRQQTSQARTPTHPG